ncbi:hypothetical protein Y032_0002g902 [Ancylostoma ceylanicum]|uniref:Uncharacterized protein n=1 Tax=Ancylostoma ceylanicum TaxID=53326 RepID=A0A016W1B4_9BILA|nr:hypothetical protein Y032_0002g902 [Ancylostoma ceylanicum]
MFFEAQNAESAHCQNLAHRCSTEMCRCRTTLPNFEEQYQAVYSSQSGTNGMKSFIIDRHSFLLFIGGFRTEIQNVSNVFLVDMSVS